ncbi:Helix-turn-helix, type 11 [uncultured Caudovirales phage]|uniref:Helix-turn-helix, type 11 n=1 Tax=uncultured Caudovirales phage TaxID=2100421 RepID=A0A6J7X2J8_9CAUD|nr:Helix-turn-helix, type 11 [uncultured Caudovirales phage]
MGMSKFVLPAKPKSIKKKQTPPRKTPFAVIPTRSLTDKTITDRNRTILAMVSSFASRAGITWVSQGRVAQELGVTRQAINKQMKILSRAGYIEKIGNSYSGKPGIAGCTWRVIYDKSLSAEDQIAIAGNGHELEVDSIYVTDEPMMEPTLPTEDAMRKRKVRELEVAQERDEVKAQDYSREFVHACRTICGVDRVLNEQDARIASELASKQLSIEKWRQILQDSMHWHQQTGRQPPSGLGYYRQVALSQQG